MEAAIYSSRSEVEETIKHWEDFPSCVDRKMHGLCKELTEKIGETQGDLQAIHLDRLAPYEGTARDERP
jgi:hypothetical protein